MKEIKLLGRKKKEKERASICSDIFIKRNEKRWRSEKESNYFWALFGKFCSIPHTLLQITYYEGELSVCTCTVTLEVIESLILIV